MSTSRSAPALEPRTRVQFLPGIGPLRAQAFERLGISTLEHLVRHYPRTWLDASRFVSVKDLRPGELLTVVGTIRHAAALRTRAGRVDFAATLHDGTGTLPCYFFGQSWLARALAPGTRVVMSGEIVGAERQMLNPLFEVVEGDLESLLHAGRLVPVHALTRGLSARGMRLAVRRALDAVADRVPDPVPASVARERALAPLPQALEELHFPPSADALEAARRRLAFEELFLLQMVMELRRRSLAEEGRALALAVTGSLGERVRASLPFALTASQESALRDITGDLARPRPMHRLVVGDVGSGKTVVALLAACQAIEAGQQAALLAPTEILARQHGAQLARFAEAAGAPVALLTGASSPGARRALQARLSAEEPMLVVGTHALLEERLRFPRLALAIVDEQHRFGVRQRAALAGKGLLPHMLVLSATPIPRTLQLAWFGDLELSVMRERPRGRGRLVTRVTGEERFPQVVEFMARELAAGRQAFVVVPAIEEGSRADLRAAETELERLRGHPLMAPYRLGLLHGRMKPDEKQVAMDAFRAGELHVLVATTVVEVGVDVPNATLMVVENAERFGLTQLHQLRGRVGRGEHRSVCVLVAGALAGARARERLAVMAKTNDGFELAEADLRMRGPGELWGTRQAGLPELKLADLARDEAQLLEARDVGRAVVAADPQLQAAEHVALRSILRERFEDALALALAG
ncbi:MAG: ATP-dependent DNA helicase RecG [Deltaproteobacteria bacterium]|nr:MAG: ATP-dependent DNA helicase RecG [Deltaproteobacteria bacterium]